MRHGSRLLTLLAAVVLAAVTHVDLTTTSYASVLEQLAAPGVVTNFGCPPYSASSTTVATACTAAGMRQWTWTVDTREWTGKSTAQVVSDGVANSRAGDTVLIHMGWNARLPRSLPCTG